MAFNKFGLHISSQQPINDGWVKKFQSPVHLVLAVGIGGELARAQQVAELCPNSLILYRAWHYGYCESDHFDQYYKKFGTDPLPLIDKHRACFETLDSSRTTYQFWNECGFDDELWPKFVEFNIKLIQEMDKRGQSCSVLGAGPGYPTGTRQAITEKWRIAKPMFEAIIGSDVQHYVNLHEYHGYPTQDYQPFLIGRFNWMLEDVQAMGLPIDRIKVIIGESGWCNPGALNLTPTTPANGYRGYLMLGVTPEQLVNDLKTAYATVYDSNPNLIGTCHYCAGDSGGWADFDLLNEPELLQRIYEMPDDVVVLDTDPQEFRVAVTKLNVRVGPSLNKAVLRTVSENDIVQTDGYVVNEEYRWRRLTFGGYCAEEYLPDSAYFLEEVLVPTWKTQAKADIEEIRTRLDDLEGLINSAS